MTSDSFFALAIGGMIALLFGSLLLLSGYRFFLFLLPIFGFFFGFGLGAETVQALFGDGFLSTITSWIVGFGMALLFAVLSYLFYIAAVAILGGALGYALAIGLLQAIGLNFGFLVWMVGIIAAIIFGAGVVLLNVQKWVIIAATAILGSAVIVGTFLLLFGGPTAQVMENPVRLALQSSPLWTITFLVLAAIGVVGQYQSTRQFEVGIYNRSAELLGAEPKSVEGAVEGPVAV
jgi:uncharacterized protein DUF4203